MARFLGIHAVVVYVLASASLSSAHGKGTFCSYFQECLISQGKHCSVLCGTERHNTNSVSHWYKSQTRKIKQMLIYDQTYVHILTFSKYNIHLKLFQNSMYTLLPSFKKKIIINKPNCRKRKPTILYAMTVLFNLMSSSNHLIALSMRSMAFFHYSFKYTTYDFHAFV